MPHLSTGPLTDGDTLALVAASGLAALLLLWHALGILCCAASRRRPQPRVLLRRARVAPPLARRAAGIATFAIVCTPAIAYADAPTPTTAPATDEPFVRAPAAPVGPDAPAPVPAPVPATPAPPPPAPVAARAHVVVPGDNLWRIASDEVARVRGVTRPTDAAIVPYWHAVVEQNRATLRSGDPSLIYPGEIVTLPAL
jgi:hypothetical protein